MKYDDASWHYGGDFPEALPLEAGATHIGMFLAWALLNGLGSSHHVREFPQGLEALRARLTTPGRFLISACDEKFTDEDLNEEGNAFTADYFDSATGQYISDYETTLASGLPSAYHVPDTWETFDKLSSVLDARYARWKESKLGKAPASNARPWWKLW